MSERVGSVRDARFLSGTDIGRTITYPDGRTATIHGIEHWANTTSVYESNDFVHVTICAPQAAVTITGADRARESPATGEG